MTAHTLIGRLFRRRSRHLYRTVRPWRSIIRRMPLSLELLEDRLAPANVIWTGNAGDNNWNTPGNWSGGSGPNGLPGAGDQVTINASGITITESGQNVSVGNVTSSAALTFTGGGSLTVTAGTSQVTAALTISPGASLTATGSSTTFSATGTTTIDGASLFAAAGANLNLSQATSYTNTATGNDQYRTLQASGTGSVLNLGGVTSVTNGTSYDTNLAVNALAGGAVNLKAVTTITDPSSGDQSYRAVAVKADGANSVVNLSALTAFADNYGGSVSGGDRDSSLAATNQGTILDGKLTTLTGVDVVLDGTGTLATAQYTTLSVSQLDLSGSATYDFSGLTSATTSVFNVNGSATKFPSLSNIDGTSVLVSGGATLSLPALTSYTNLATGNDQYRTLQASGAGSVLDLGKVASVTNGTAYNTNLAINALAGGTVNLSAAATITDPNTGDQSYRAIAVKADGANSVVNLSALTAFTDNYGGSVNGGDRYSSLTATNKGAIQDGKLTALTGVDVVEDGTGTLATAQYATLTSSQLDLNGSTTFDFGGLTSATASVFNVNGAATNFAKLTDIDGTSIFVSGGADVAILAATSYTNTVIGNDQHRTLQASGAGSVLDLHNVKSITNGTNYDTRLAINALSGGGINLSGLASISDGSTGDFNYRSVDVLADGTGSSIDLSGLISFQDGYAGSTTNGNLFSTLTARNSGTIKAAALTTLVGVAISIDATGGTLTAPNLASATQGQISVNGALATFSKLATIDGSHLLVSGGGTLALPAVAAYTNQAAYNDEHWLWQATGAGSTLDLHDLAAISNGTDYDTRLAVQALAGAAVNLSALTLITEPTTGDLNYRSVNVLADGKGSTVDLSALTTFQDYYAGSSTNGNLSSTLTVSNGGAIKAGALTTPARCGDQH
jgi:hypothetical protein